MANLLQWGKDRLKDAQHVATAAYHGVTPLDGGQGWTNKAPAPAVPKQVQQQVQNAKYGVLANNPQRQQQFLRDVAPPSIASQVLGGAKAGVISASAIPRGIAGGLVNTAQVPYDLARMGTAAVTRNGTALTNAANTTSNDALNSLMSFAVKPLSKGVNAVAQPYAMNKANEAEAYAKHVLGGAYSPYNGGQNQAEIEAGLAKLALLKDSIAGSGMAYNDTLKNNALKAVPEIASGVANAALFGVGGKLSTQALKSAGLMGLASAADTAASENPELTDYIKNAAIGAGMGLAAPVAFRAAGQATGRGKDFIASERAASPKAQLDIELGILRDLKAAEMRAKGGAKQEARRMTLEQQVKVNELKQGINQGGYAALPGKSPKDPQQNPGRIPNSKLVQPKAVSSKTSVPDKVEQLRKQNSVPAPELERIDQLNKAMVEAVDAPKMKIPKTLKGGGVNERLEYHELRNKVLATKAGAGSSAAIPAPRKPSVPTNRKTHPVMPLQLKNQAKSQVNKAGQAPLPPKPQLKSQPNQSPSLSQNRAILSAPESPANTASRQPSAQQSYQRAPDQTSSVSKIQQKTPVVNEGRRVMEGANRTSYGLRESFAAKGNVPKELKDALGAFGNERTVKSNKELWQNAQRRVGTDPAGAMKYFGENSGDEAVATGYALINRYMKAGQSKEAGEVAMTMAERALEAGRTTQAYSLMKKLTPEGSIQYVENKIARYTKQNPKQAGKLNWDDKTRKELYDLADKVNKMPEGRDRNLTIGRMQELVDNIFPSSLADKAITVWKAGLLTSLRTHERNMLGNLINYAAERVATAPGALADRLMSTRTGARTLVATNKGSGAGVKTGYQIAKDQIKTGIDVTNSNLKYNINHVTWGNSKAEQTLKKYTDRVFRPLGAEDKLFKESVRQNSYMNQALAEGKTKGLTGLALKDFAKEKAKAPTAKMMDIADQDAGRATFSHDNVLGDIIREAKGAVRRSNKPGAKAASTALDVLVPFTQVPTGVASQLYAYSPAKLVKSLYEISEVIRTKNPELQRTAAQGFGRSVVGSTLLVAGGYLANKGMLTGQPKDDAEKAQWEAQGIKPNSVKIGDKWYGLSSIGPQNLLVLAGAQYQADKKAGEGSPVNVAANLAKNFKDQTFLKGMSSALDAVGDPQRYASSYLEQQASSIVPNLAKDAARAVDPNEREVRGISDKFKQSIPGLSKSLPERKDSYGQTVKNSGALELIDLFNSSRQKDLPPAQFVEKLREQTGLKEHIPTKVQKTIQINGESKKLNSKEYSDYQGAFGTGAKELISKLSKDPGFTKLAPEEQVKKIDGMLQDLNSAVKIKLFKDKGYGTDQYNPTKIPKSVRGILSGAIPTYEDQKLELPKGMNGHDVATLKRFSDITADEKDKIIRSEKDAEYKLALAEFERDKKLGRLSRVEEMRAKDSLAKRKVGADYDKDTREFYELSKGDIEDYIFNEKDGKAVAERLLAYDDALVAAGVLAKNKFRDKNGRVDFETATSRRGRAAGKGSAAAKNKESLSKLISTVRATTAAIKPPKVPTKPNFSVKTGGTSKMKQTQLKKYAVSRISVSKKA